MGGAPGGAGSGGLAGSPATGGTSGSGGSAGMAEILPRPTASDGVSVLDVSRNALSMGGLCGGNGAYCNGTCLAAEGDSEGNCTALKLGVGQTDALALSPDALYYSAANQEILRMGLSDRAHTSLVRGLEFVRAITVSGDSLLFTTNDPDGFFISHVRRTGLMGGDQTVLSQYYQEPIAMLEVVGDRLLIGAGNFTPYPLDTLPSTGGPSETFGGVEAYWLEVDGSTVYYLNGGICSTSVAAPAPGTCLNAEAAGSRFFLHEGYLYDELDEVYRRTPVAGGPSEMVQAFAAETAILGRTPSDVLLVRRDETNTAIAHLFSMPIEGGDEVELATFEEIEWQALVANETHVYIAVGQSYAGAILAIEL
jgi:hypothetical protein